MGRKEDAAKYGKLAQDIRKAYNEKYYHPRPGVMTRTARPAMRWRSTQAFASRRTAMPCWRTWCRTSAAAAMR